MKIPRQAVQSWYEGFMQSPETKSPSNSPLHHLVLMVQYGSQNSGHHSCIPGSKMKEG